MEREYFFSFTGRCTECDEDSYYHRVVNFPVELDFNDSQEYILEYLSDWLSREDSECEHCGQIGPESVIRYESCGYEHDIFGEGYVYSRFKVINLSIHKIDLNDSRVSPYEVLVAKLAEMDIKGFFSPLETKLFVFHTYQAQAKNLIANPEKQVQLDTDDFMLLRQEDGIKAYYHMDYATWYLQIQNTKDL